MALLDCEVELSSRYKYLKDLVSSTAMTYDYISFQIQIPPLEIEPLPYRPSIKMPC